MIDTVISLFYLMKNQIYKRWKTSDETADTRTRSVLYATHWHISSIQATFYISICIHDEMYDYTLPILRKHLHFECTILKVSICRLYVYAEIFLTPHDRILSHEGILSVFGCQAMMCTKIEKFEWICLFSAISPTERSTLRFVKQLLQAKLWYNASLCSTSNRVHAFMWEDERDTLSRLPSEFLGKLIEPRNSTSCITY